MYSLWLYKIYKMINYNDFKAGFIRGIKYSNEQKINEDAIKIKIPGDPKIKKIWEKHRYSG